jgi:ribosomal protein S18 acetylase RimI-like enzyme
MRALLPRLFFEHFRETSFVAEDGGEVVGFLNGFLSQSSTDEAYIHFVGVRPDRRGTGLARELYDRFFAVARAHGRTLVRCVTSPVNEGSVAFHRALGFEVERSDEYMLFAKRI